MLSLNLPQDVENRLMFYAQKNGQGTAEFVAAMITEYLNDLEDLRIARERMADVESGKTQLIDFEDILKKYPLNG